MDSFRKLSDQESQQWLVNEQQPGDEPENCVKAWIDWIGSAMQMLEEADRETAQTGWWACERGYRGDD